MTIRKVTCIILIVTAVVWAAWDFVPFYSPQRGDTISEVMMYYSLRCFSLPMMFGVLCAHFFWPWDGYRPNPKALFSIAFAVILMDVLAHVLNVRFLLDVVYVRPYIAFLVGVPVGHFYWPQSRKDKM